MKVIKTINKIIFATGFVLLGLGILIGKITSCKKKSSEKDKSKNNKASKEKSSK